LANKEYIEGFTEAQRLIRSSSEPTDEIIEFLIDRRRQYRGQRDSAKAIAERMNRERPPFTTGETWNLVSAYAESIQNYFSASGEVARVSWYSDYLCNVRDMKRLALGTNVWRDLSVEGNPQAELLSRIDNILDVQLPEAYRDVVASYAALRAHLL
jgi:hypothetical protein